MFHSEVIWTTKLTNLVVQVNQIKCAGKNQLLFCGFQNVRSKNNETAGKINSRDGILLWNIYKGNILDLKGRGVIAPLKTTFIH